MLAFSRLFLFAAMTFASTATVSSAYAEKRVALVIGNDKYPNLPPNQQLLKAGNDADAIGNAFAALDFKVIRGKNLGRQAIIDRLSELTSAVGPDDTVALFFAGHGVAIGGVNYIVPSDVPEVVAGSESRVRGASIAETDLIAEIQTKNVRVALLVLDACRDNPFPVSGTRSIGNTRGLTESRPARGVFTIYSAGIGQQALDRLNDNEKNPNSVFTRVFAQKLTQPGLTLGDLAVEVREQVAELAQTYKDPDGTPHEQTPAYYDQTIGGRVYLAGRGSVLEQSKPNLPLPSASSSPAIDEITWDFLKQSTDTESLRRFTSQFPLSTRKTEAIQRIADLERAAKDAQSKAKKDNPSIASQPPSEQAPSKSWTSFFAPSKASTELQKSTEPSGQSYGGAATDQEAWASIKNSTDIDVLRQFSSRFPASQYGFQANDRIAKLEAATEQNIRQNAIKRDRDLGTISIDLVPEAWETVRNSTDPQVFESFLAQLNLLTHDDVTQQIYLGNYIDRATVRLKSIRGYELTWSGWKDLSDSAKLGLLQSDQVSAPSSRSLSR